MAKQQERRRYLRIEHPGGEETPIRFELFSTERLEQHARSLAQAQKNAKHKEGRKLIPRVQENCRILLDAYEAVAREVREQRAITPAAEWLLDNFHVIQEQVSDIHVDLPESFYQELPKLTEGPFAGFPRVYGIAWALVAHTDSRFDPEALSVFIRAYQEVEPLMIGELWAIASTLRILLVENLRRMAVRIMRSQTGRRLANEFLDRMEQSTIHIDKTDLPLPQVVLPSLPLRQSYVVQIMQRLHDPHPDMVALSLDFLNEWLDEQEVTLDEVVHREHADQIADNQSVRNIIISMRSLSAFEWPRFVEDASLVDETLRTHEGFSAMDFLTRDRYRHAIEELAKRSSYSEVEIARQVIKKVRVFNESAAVGERKREPGYYLIGAGRYAFEREVDYQPSFKQQFLRGYIAHAGLAYIASLGLLTLLLLAFPLSASLAMGVSQFHLFLLAIFGVFPASDIAIGLVNRLIIASLPPRYLPRFDMSYIPRLDLKDSVPEMLSVFVVVPTLFDSEAGVKEQVEQMEIRYLSNPGGHVLFALLSDWCDADQEVMPNDERLLNIAIEEVAALNVKYGEQRFYVFHRKRLWNPGEGKWMGWERKRGKLHEFNRLLRGATDTTFLPIDGKPAAAPSGICYIITIDADTKLPMGVVSKLVGVAAHPLNQPVFDPKVQRVVSGYGILQPRVTPTLPQRHEYSMFHRIFAGDSGTNAYSSSVSELYQDLFALGTFSGKGLYHIDSFEAALAGRVPENTLLSHDLFESVYARCALVNDIEFFEEFPSHAEVAALREHRWTRGDWQLLPWIFGPRGKGMPIIGRWKMIDNLRRSLSAPGALFTLVAALAIPNAPQATLIGLVMMALAFPAITSIISWLTTPLHGMSLSTYLRVVGEQILWALIQSLAALTLLAQQAWLMMDAIIRTLVRLFITRRHLLSWVTALQTKSTAGYSTKKLILSLGSSSIVIISAGVLVLFFNPAGSGVAAPFLLLWWLAPIVAHALSLPPSVDRTEYLEPSDSEPLRFIGRRIWRFFTTFVTAEEHFLPPDNFQEIPNPVIAHRSSPTNFGVYLLSVAAARDFGWLGLMDTVDRLEATLTTLIGLPRLHGHFYNWYDTSDLHPLEPRYVSTVDSGNLAGHLLALAQFCQEMLSKPLDLTVALAGLRDTHQLLMAEIAKISDDRRTLTVTLKELQKKCVILGELLESHPVDPEGWNRLCQQLTIGTSTLLDMVHAFTAERSNAGDSEVLAWVTLLSDDVRSHARDVDNLIPWIYCGAHSLNMSNEPEAQAHYAMLQKYLAMDIPLNKLAECYTRALTDFDSFEDSLAPDEREALHHAGERAEVLTKRLEKMIVQMETLFQEMDFRFLYNHESQLFALGYRVTEGVLDSSYYDMLASEARLSSFIAIAKRDVPAPHWFRLGRRVTRAAGGAVLLSWSGSMFEYLMPSLVMFSPRYSLVNQTCRLVVKRQIEYGKKRGVPWGISESAFNSRDLYFTYQYTAFGVPGLGMKRGLGEDLVIAPYATALAAMYLPHAAVENFKRLEKEGALGRFGFYEALDYTPVRLAEGQRVAVVRCYMAHHQGMSLVALANVVYDGVMRHRFHSTPLIQAAALLLQERIPTGADIINMPILQDLAEVRESQQPPVRGVPLPMSSVPSAHLLSNGRYAVMITAGGSGYSFWRNLAVTRWREDVTRDNCGSYIYLRDVANGQVWSAGYQPTVLAPDHHEVFFAEDRARITRTDGSMVSILEIVVSPEDDAEIRRLSLTNNGQRTREIEITSYAEIVLAPFPADIAHPAFSNLFVQTEYRPQVRGLIAHRRQRTADDPVIWAAHVLADGRLDDGVQYETDRARFVGRGQTLREPIAVMDGRPLSNTIGSVLDPIFCLRTRIRIAPGVTEHVTFTTLIAASRQAVEELTDKYYNLAAFERVSALAWTHAHVQLHYLRTSPDEAQLFQDLASRLLYADPWLRPSSKQMQMNKLNVTSLWQYGISGDRPIVLLRIKEPEDRIIVEQLLRAHEYWRMKCLAVDLIILNEKEVSYVDDLQVLLERMVRENQALLAHQEHEDHGKIFIMRIDQITVEERLLLHTAARVVLVSSRGTLAEQLLRHPRQQAAFVASKARFAHPGSPPPRLSIPTLEYFNGLGGFSDNGREYVIVLDNGQWTPAPWINVIANSGFGFMVSEAGSGCTWCGNSRQNQLTPWSNDPVSDPSGEVFYVRDDETNELWSPTALPIRVDNTSYVIRHGQGYSRFEHASHGIHSELLQFVSPDDPVKISSLTLTNISGRHRRLTVTSYVEWVLGASRTVTALHVITELDQETGALFAYNPWDMEFGQRIAFVDLAGRQTGWTGSRSEFIGRNGSLDAPAALLTTRTLRKRVGAGLDPCAALDTVVELAPKGRVEIVFMLGQGSDRAHARELVQRYRETEVATTFAGVNQSWEQVLSKVQVKTPDRELDFILNRWLLYQTLSCRMWARAAFYQVGGAFGFRDQLQDSMALVIARPDLAREHLLRAAARQFGEGDVQHWWHPPSGRGVRTRFSDDRIWLPYAVFHYIKVSGDSDVLDEIVPFLEGPVLKSDQDDAYYEPTQSVQQATLFEHCARALDLSLQTGSHGLPLMGSGDWNDGMNRVGNQGKGESIWMAWFLISTLSDFTTVAEVRGENERVSRWREHVVQLTTAVEAEGWDGAWYRRAYFDDGAPLGAASNTECRIDSIAQSWGVISGAADTERAQRAMNSVREYLVRYGDLVLLFTPPFDKTERDPGYIKSYPPGVRENGGQYTHAAIWSVIAYAMLGDGDQAVELLRMLNPINRTATRTGVYAYKVEPYVLAADIYAEPPHVRRGGWTWYTGAAGWYYRAGLEWILGLQIRAGKLFLDPCISKAWRSYSIFYQHGNARYEIIIENPNGVERGIVTMELDGERQSSVNGITLQDDGKQHYLRVVLG